MYIAERSETAWPIETRVNRAGGVSGLTVLLGIRDTLTDNSYLDFGDLPGGFKTAGWTTQFATLTEIGSTGRYRLSPLLDISAIGNLPAGTHNLAVEFRISGGPLDGEIWGYTLQLVTTFKDIASSAAGLVDWSNSEREQIRDALGVDGTKTAATGGQMQTVRDQANKIDSAATTAPATATNGSLLDRIVNKPSTKGYDQELHSLENVSKQLGEADF